MRGQDIGRKVAQPEVSIQLDTVADLVRAAADGSIDEALLKHGEVINGREGAALRQLSAQEFQTLAQIRQKIRDTAFGDFDPMIADWTCGLIC